MKNGKNPSREQRRLLERYGLNTYDWLVVKDTPLEMEVVHRFGTTRKRINKEWKQ